MAIFNSYVGLPEGILAFYFLSGEYHNSWTGNHHFHHDTTEWHHELCPQWLGVELCVEPSWENCSPNHFLALKLSQKSVFFWLVLHFSGDAEVWSFSAIGVLWGLHRSTEVQRFPVPLFFGATSNWRGQGFVSSHQASCAGFRKDRIELPVRTNQARLRFSALELETSVGIIY